MLCSVELLVLAIGLYIEVDYTYGKPVITDVWDMAELNAISYPKRKNCWSKVMNSVTDDKLVALITYDGLNEYEPKAIINYLRSIQDVNCTIFSEPDTHCITNRTGNERETIESLNNHDQLTFVACKTAQEFININNIQLKMIDMEDFLDAIGIEINEPLDWKKSKIFFMGLRALKMFRMFTMTNAVKLETLKSAKIGFKLKDRQCNNLYESVDSSMNDELNLKRFIAFTKTVHLMKLYLTVLGESTSTEMVKLQLKKNMQQLGVENKEYNIHWLEKIFDHSVKLPEKHFNFKEFVVFMKMLEPLQQCEINKCNEGLGTTEMNDKMLTKIGFCGNRNTTVIIVDPIKQYMTNLKLWKKFNRFNPTNGSISSESCSTRLATVSTLSKEHIDYLIRKSQNLHESNENSMDFKTFRTFITLFYVTKANVQLIGPNMKEFIQLNDTCTRSSVLLLLLCGKFNLTCENKTVNFNVFVDLSIRLKIMDVFAHFDLNKKLQASEEEFNYRLWFLNFSINRTDNKLMDYITFEKLLIILEMIYNQDLIKCMGITLSQYLGVPFSGQFAELLNGLDFKNRVDQFEVFFKYPADIEIFYILAIQKLIF